MVAQTLTEIAVPDLFGMIMVAEIAVLLALLVVALGFAP